MAPASPWRPSPATSCTTRCTISSTSPASAPYLVNPRPSAAADPSSGGPQPEVRAPVRGIRVDQAVRGHDQVVPELGGERLVQLELVQGDAHVVQPGVPFGLADGEPGVPHAEPGMPA